MKTSIKKPLRTASNALLLCGGLLAIVNGLTMIAPPLEDHRPLPTIKSRRP